MQIRPVRLAKTLTIFWMFLVHGRSEDRMNPTSAVGEKREKAVRSDVVQMICWRCDGYEQLQMCDRFT